MKGWQKQKYPWKKIPKIKVLRDANVVDAGAQGFVHFLEVSQTILQELQ
jgi:dihydroxyacetone kinase-like predicted kinase